MKNILTILLLTLTTSFADIDLDDFDTETIIEEEEEKKETKAASSAIANVEIGVLEYRLTLIRYLVIITAIFLIVTLLFMKLNGNNSTIDITNITGLILIIQATIFIVIASPSTEALTAAIGVIGTIVGYLFRAANEKVKNDNIQDKK